MGVRGGVAVSLILVAMGMAGCFEGSAQPPAPILKCPDAVIHKVSGECPAQKEMIELKNKCFEALDNREQKISELQSQLITLQEESKMYRDEANEWQKRFNDFQCE